MNDDDAAISSTESSSLSTKKAVVTTTHRHRHFKIYKPAKVLTQFKFTHRKRRNRTLLGDVITDGALPCGVMAIGRLDEDSEGLLLLTTDGKVSEQVRRKSVEKEYYVQLDGQITQEAIKQLQNGVKISLPANNKNSDNDESACESSTSPASTKYYTTLPCRARVLDTAIINIENKKTAATAKEEAKQPSEEKKQQQKKRKFGGTCNRCKLTGHKAKECSENPVDFSNTNDCQDGDNMLLQLALPAGIPPPTPSRDRYYIRNTTLSRHNRPTSWISITIKEGKNRQIRRMTAAVGFPTMRLVRVRIGTVMLDGMVAGEVRELNNEVIDL
jgi:pseudouridine synthase